MRLYMVLEVHNSASAIEPCTMAEATARRPFFRPITLGEFVTCKYDAAGMVKEMASAPVAPKMPHITDTDGITTASRNCDAYRANVYAKKTRRCCRCCSFPSLVELCRLPPSLPLLRHRRSWQLWFCSLPSAECRARVASARARAASRANPPKPPLTVRARVRAPIGCWWLRNRQ